MPKRNKLPPIPDYNGFPTKEDMLVVRKSNPLATLSETSITLPQFKILDAYLGRINPLDPDKRYVHFEKGELEQLLGVTRILEPDLKERLKNLFQVVTIKDKNKKKGFTMIALFEKAEAYKDEDGLWQIDLACTPSAMEYIFNIENYGYLTYMFKYIPRFTSRYSYVLFVYLVQHRKLKSWKISIAELRQILNCTAESYADYKAFNKDILKKCFDEITGKTDLRYSYTPVDRKARRYTAIYFTVETIADKIAAQTADDCVLEGQLSFEKADDPDSRYSNEIIAGLASSCNYEFDESEITLISDIIKDKELESDPYDAVGTHRFARERYLSTMYNRMDYEDKHGNIKSKKPNRRLQYLLGMLKNDIKA